jgi:hypothetical protein
MEDSQTGTAKKPILSKWHNIVCPHLFKTHTHTTHTKHTPTSRRVPNLGATKVVRVLALGVSIQGGVMMGG